MRWREEEKTEKIAWGEEKMEKERVWRRSWSLEKRSYNKTWLSKIPTGTYFLQPGPAA